MTGLPSFEMIALAAAMTLAGLLFGLIYFASLERTVLLFVAGRGWLGPLSLTLGRLAGAAFLLGFAAKLGAFFLLAAFLGFLLARAIALRSERRTG